MILQCCPTVRPAICQSSQPGLFCSCLIADSEFFNSSFPDSHRSSVTIGRGIYCIKGIFVRALVCVSPRLRQQLANATASDSRYNAEMLDGTIEARENWDSLSMVEL